MDEILERARQAVERLTAAGVDVVRLSYPDLMGTDRGRDILVDQLPRAAEHGIAFCRAVYHTSPRGDVVDVPGGLDRGLPDILVRPDLTTLTPVPWEPGVASCLGDAYVGTGDAPCQEAPREVLRRVLGQLGQLDLFPVVGPELEYFLCERDTEGNWRRYDDAPGNVYVAGRKGDRDAHLTATLRRLRDLGVGVVAANHEFCGGQFEINLDHSPALDAADRAFRFKSAVQELARCDGRLATFMAKPFNDEGGSGFHLHVSCADGTGGHVFGDTAAEDGLSETARQAIAGLLAHAPAIAALLNPTINSYKRFGPDTLAPWLVDWGYDNRSAMVRVPQERGDGTRLEIRLGDASANPYLAVAGVLAGMFVGIRDHLQPPAPLDGYGYDAAAAAMLPTSLRDALDALSADDQLTAVLGKEFVTAFLTYKRDEIGRFSRYVTDWEFREYAYHL